VNGSRGDRDTPWRLIIAVVLAVLALIFVFQNRARVSMHYLWANFTSPLWLMLVVTLLIGVVIGWLVRRRAGRRGYRVK
jgi:lipopolysaccharide assembly protein A